MTAAAGAAGGIATRLSDGRRRRGRGNRHAALTATVTPPLSPLPPRGQTAWMPLPYLKLHGIVFLFAASPETERLRINAWVAERTRERIQNIIPENALPEATQLVLANAVY